MSYRCWFNQGAQSIQRGVAVSYWVFRLAFYASAYSYFCVFQRVYLKMANFEDGLYHWSPNVHDEIVGVLFMLPQTEANIRAPVSGQVSATDATVTAGGSCIANVSSAVAELAYKRSEKARRACTPVLISRCSRPSTQPHGPTDLRYGFPSGVTSVVRSKGLSLPAASAH